MAAGDHGAFPEKKLDAGIGRMLAADRFFFGGELRGVRAAGFVQRHHLWEHPMCRLADKGGDDG